MQLAALALRRRERRSGDAANITGGSSPLFDYLTQEILAQLTQPIYHFVLCSCILEQLTGSLCNALTGQENGHELLRLLDQRNLFLIPLDEERRWYRYHPLFAVLRITETFNTGLDGIARGIVIALLLALPDFPGAQKKVEDPIIMDQRQDMNLDVTQADHPFQETRS